MKSGSLRQNRGVSDRSPAVFLHVLHDVGGLFRVDVTGWPAGVNLAHPEVTFGNYWPPFGWRLVEETKTEPERVFPVDLGSEASLARFESDFGLYLSEHLAGKVPVHAALLRIDDAVVIVPGTSGVGKSTLSRAALDAGFEVWSDEYCLIDTETGEVSGWPRPVRERVAGGGIRRIPLPGPHGPGVATHVLMLRFDSNTEGLALSPLSPGDVALGLLANTVCARSRPEESFRVAARIARSVTGLSGTRGEVTDALSRLPAVLREARPV